MWLGVLDGGIALNCGLLGGHGHRPGPVCTLNLPISCSLASPPNFPIPGAGMEVRSEAKSVRSDSRGRLADSELSAAALDRVARQAAALALGPPPLPGVAPASLPRQLQHPAAAAELPRQAQQLAADGGAAMPGGIGAQELQQPQPASTGGSPSQQFQRDPTLSYPRDERGDIPVETSPGKAALPSDSLTFRPGGSVALEGAPAYSGAAAHPPAPESDTATRGSLHGSLPPHSGVHQRTASAGSAAAVRSVHYKSLSADSTCRGEASWLGAVWAALGCSCLLGFSAVWGCLDLPQAFADPSVPSCYCTPFTAGAGGSLSGRASPRSTPGTSHHQLTPIEHLMASRLHEFGDSRGIAAGALLAVALAGGGCKVCCCLKGLPACCLARAACGASRRKRCRRR